MKRKKDLLLIVRLLYSCLLYNLTEQMVAGSHYSTVSSELKKLIKYNTTTKAMSNTAPSPGSHSGSMAMTFPLARPQAAPTATGHSVLTIPFPSSSSSTNSRARKHAGTDRATTVGDVQTSAYFPVPAAATPATPATPTGETDATGETGDQGETFVFHGRSNVT